MFGGLRVAAPRDSDYFYSTTGTSDGARVGRRTRSVDLTATSTRTDSPPRVSFSWAARSPPLSTTIATTLHGWDSAARETRPSLSMALCGDGGSFISTMMDACNHVRAQESVRCYGRESVERNLHDSETNRRTLVLRRL
ncbi:hypothetical protein ACS0PU_007305 [Formica fusca]